MGKVAQSQAVVVEQVCLLTTVQQVLEIGSVDGPFPRRIGVARMRARAASREESGGALDP